MIDKDYYSLWQREVVSTEPFAMAVEGGRVAENPGLIFIAGYQAALRATFPELTARRWYSFAVSEDRSPESTRPGVRLDQGSVTGFKTWIAAVDCVDALVLKVGSGPDARYGLVEASDPGTSFVRKPEPGFLAPMSQGVAEFNAAQFTELEDASRVAQFRMFEPTYIYVALLARLSAMAVAISEQAEAVLQQHAEKVEWAALDASVQDILTLMTEHGIELGNHWRTDRRLFTMYSKQHSA